MVFLACIPVLPSLSSIFVLSRGTVSCALEISLAKAEHFAREAVHFLQFNWGLIQTTPDMHSCPIHGLNLRIFRITVPIYIITIPITSCFHLLHRMDCFLLLLHSVLCTFCVLLSVEIYNFVICIWNFINVSTQLSNPFRLPHCLEIQIRWCSDLSSHEVSTVCHRVRLL